MKKITNKIKTGCEIFGDGFVAQLGNQYTIGIALTLGVYQGLKYNGNFMRGVKTGGVVLGVIGVAGGIQHVARNWQFIKQS